MPENLSHSGLDMEIRRNESQLQTSITKLLETPLSHLSAYLNDDDYADLDDVAHAMNAIDHARSQLATLYSEVDGETRNSN